MFITPKCRFCNPGHDQHKNINLHCLMSCNIRSQPTLNYLFMLPNVLLILLIEHKVKTTQDKVCALLADH